jgi:hypothetical protein
LLAAAAVWEEEQRMPQVVLEDVVLEQLGLHLLVVEEQVVLNLLVVLVVTHGEVEIMAQVVH